MQTTTLVWTMFTTVAMLLQPMVVKGQDLQPPYHVHGNKNGSSLSSGGPRRIVLYDTCTAALWCGMGSHLWFSKGRG